MSCACREVRSCYRAPGCVCREIRNNKLKQSFSGKPDGSLVLDFDQSHCLECSIKCSFSNALYRKSCTIYFVFVMRRDKARTFIASNTGITFSTVIQAIAMLSSSGGRFS
ncbi:unnamed protein product [Albugo candida]|uniref:Uncharacterized protein n=1 Tax=Albugo candida TaxID=65357 RepID=A0A024FVF2_9STRA|nr:unnamed protein product [Albugo candida]|eukprot:CCI10897.1 unnamed protein product [Albugo candida]